MNGHWIRAASRAAGAAILLTGAMSGGALAAGRAIGFKHDASRPIEVTADKMEVRQDERTASFKGHVVAEQGKLELRADAIKVYYTLSKSKEAAAEIDRIDAQGGVVVTSPAEQARGEWGVYDVERELITLGGSVVLSRGDTVIQGSRLELNLKTGLSRMVSTAEPGGSERVRGVFAPPKAGAE